MSSSASDVDLPPAAAAIETTAAGPSETPPNAQGAPRALLSNPAPVAVLAVVVATFAFISYPAGAGAAIAAFVSAVVVVLAAVDLERRIIPNQIVLPAAAIALAARLAFYPDRALEFVLAAAVAAGALLISNIISSSSMGMGDVKFGLLLGAALGWGAVGAIVVAFFCVLPFAVATLLRGGLAARKATLPFGPFLALGALVIMIGPRLAGFGGQ